MKKEVLIIIVVSMAAAGIFACGCTSVGESIAKEGYDFSTVDKIAVVDVTGKVHGEDVRNQICDFLEMELLKKGYSPVERSRVQTLLKERKFQATDITGTEYAARAGKILNVPTALIANIPNYGSKMSLTVKMVDVENGSVIWIGNGSGKTGEGMNIILGAVTGALAGAGAAGAAGGESGTQLAGGIAGAVLGGMAGETLTPQQSSQLQKVIKKIFKSMPHR